MATWTTEIYDDKGQLVADVSDKSLVITITKNRNRPETIVLRYDLDAIKRLVNNLKIDVTSLFATNLNEVRIKRNDTVYVAGQISNIQPYASRQKREITIIAVGWLQLFSKRVTDGGGSGSAYYFSAVDAGQIGWGLINASQNETNGDFGIVQGNIQASITRDRKDYEDKNIYDALVQLTEVIKGFDHEITWDKKYNVYYPKIGQRLENLHLTYPGNIADIGFTRDGMSATNQVIAKGAGSGADAFRAIASSVADQTTYKLRQDILIFNDIVNANTLQEHADEELRVVRTFFDVPEVVLDPAKAPPVTSYSIGDEIKIDVSEDLDIFATVNDWFRIERITLTLKANQEEDVRLLLAR